MLVLYVKVPKKNLPGPLKISSVQQKLNKMVIGLYDNIPNIPVARLRVSINCEWFRKFSLDYGIARQDTLNKKEEQFNYISNVSLKEIYNINFF